MGKCSKPSNIKYCSEKETITRMSGGQATINFHLDLPHDWEYNNAGTRLDELRLASLRALSSLQTAPSIYDSKLDYLPAKLIA
jgi:hypothetical protein